MTACGSARCSTRERGRRRAAAAARRLVRRRARRACSPARASPRWTPTRGTATLATTAHDAALRPRRAVHRLRRARPAAGGRRRSPGVHVFRDPADCAAIVARRRGRRGARPSSAAACSGSRPRYALARLGCATTVVHLVDRLMERQLDAPAAALLAPGDRGARRRRARSSTRRAAIVAGAGRRASRACAFADGDDAGLRPRRRRRRHPAARRPRPRGRAWTSSAGSSSTTALRHLAPARARGRRVRPAPRRRARHRRADPRPGAGRRRRRS